jgi:regulator of protease activity HflC (stomatin/prohibitin superfamily)
VEIDLQETMAHVGGQGIMTADKVTPRLNAVVTYKIVDARKAISKANDVRQTLYGEMQLPIGLSYQGLRRLSALHHLS